MSNTFFCSDHHFGHAGILGFKTNEGTPLRDFSSMEEMHEHMIAMHNSVVRPKDKVYFLGDVAFNKKGLIHLARLNGEKVLIKGNHDKEKITAYLEYFKDVRACHQFDGMILSHIPIHPGSLARWGVNIHGHTHSNSVLLPDGTIDTRYICVSMEQIQYIPASIEDIKMVVGGR